MGRIVATFFTTVDGIVESPDRWQLDEGSEELGAVITGNNDASEAFLMGRRLYDEWSAYWPEHADDDVYGGYINAVPKHVLSTTLTDPSWDGTSVLASVEDVRRLKESATKQIAMFGSATTVRALLDAGLVDELCLIASPIAYGEGARLFDGTRHRFEAVSSDVLPKSVVVTRYRVLPG